jgi:hypothetical protein
LRLEAQGLGFRAAGIGFKVWVQVTVKGLRFFSDHGLELIQGL